MPIGLEAENPLVGLGLEVDPLWLWLLGSLRHELTIGLKRQVQ